MRTLAIVLLLSSPAMAAMAPRIIQRCDGVVVRVWCDKDGCSRDPEVIPENKIKRHWWQVRRKVRVDYREQDMRKCGTELQRTESE